MSPMYDILVRLANNPDCKLSGVPSESVIDILTLHAWIISHHNCYADMRNLQLDIENVFPIDSEVLIPNSIYSYCIGCLQPISSDDTFTESIQCVPTCASSIPNWLSFPSTTCDDHIIWMSGSSYQITWIAQHSSDRAHVYLDAINIDWNRFPIDDIISKGIRLIKLHTYINGSFRTITPQFISIPFKTSSGVMLVILGTILIGSLLCSRLISKVK